MIRRLSFAALVIAASSASAQQPVPTTTRPMTAADTAMAPPVDQGRAVEAEVRIALNELLANRTVSALQRLQRAATLAPSGAAATGASSSTGTLRDRTDVLFLLAQAQYRLGMDSAFRTSAQDVLSSGSPRYAALLRSQLLLSAYRTGDFARVSQLVQSADVGQNQGLASLVSGLAAYQTKNYAEARTKFAAAKASGAGFAPYAEYMDALTTLRVDTTQSASALARLEALAQSGTGTFADQVRLTAAQLAYQTGAYDRAIALATAVTPTGGLAPIALLTKAWSQYKAKDVAGAGQSFAAFADQYPQLPQRDEARLMAAQSLLQVGQTDAAGRLFAMVSDSAKAEAPRLSATSNDGLMSLARALVQSRSAGLLFVNDPEMGKTLALDQSAGADPQVLAAAMSGGSPTLPNVEVARIVSLNDLTQRFATFDSSLSANAPKRVLYAPASANAAPTVFAQRAEAVLAADIDAAVASQRLRLAQRNDASRVAQIRALQRAMQGGGDTVAKLVARVDTTVSRLGRLLGSVDSTELNLRSALTTQVRNVPGGPAYVLSVRAESLQARGQIPAGVDVEGLVATRADSLIRALPLFLLRDSVRAREARIQTQLAESKTALQEADQMFAAASAGALIDTAGAMTGLREAQASAQSRRDAAEAALMAAVSTELGARAAELLATLEHDQQAAEFGVATTSFFKTIDQNKAPGAPVTTGATGATGAAERAKPLPLASTGTPPTQKK